MRIAKKHNKEIIIKFTSEDKSEFYDVLGKVKNIPGRKWQDKTRSWLLPLSKRNILFADNLGFDLCPELLRWKKKASKDIQVNIKIPENKPYFNFQKEGIINIEKFGGRVLLADEMGLGKTCQSIGWFSQRKNIFPIIIIVPATIKLKWKREILKWSDIIKETDIYIVYGRQGNAKELKDKKIIIINYDIVFNEYEKQKQKEIEYTGWKNYLIDLNPKLIICDESHKCKNEKAKRTKAIKSIVKNVNNLIMISGTPITKRPIDIFTTLNMLQPGVWNSRWQFAQRYCAPEHNGFGWDFTGASNMEELHKILKENVMIRRLKKDVLKDLPPKQRSVIPLEMESNWNWEYHLAENNLLNWIRKNEGKEKADNAEKAEALIKIEKLKQISMAGKQEAVENWISDFLESGEKLVIGCTHRTTVDYLNNKFSDISVIIDGRHTAEEKDQNANAFQNDNNIKLAICNISAAGVGIDLFAASNIAMIEIGKSSTDHDQMEDRIHRIGQEADSIMVWYLIAVNTIEEDLIESLDAERKNITAIMDGKNISSIDLISEVLKKFKKRKTFGMKVYNNKKKE